MALDQNALNSLRELDPDGSTGVYSNIIQTYLADAAALMEQIKAAVAANDAASLARHAHTLKSTSMSLGATRVSAIAREMEGAAKSGATATCPLFLTALTAEHSAAVKALEAEYAAAQRKVSR